MNVTDTGPGIPTQYHDRLFQPYFSGRPAGEGTGLGLAIARKIALDHGGDLQLDESSEEGSTFRLLIPAVPSEGGHQ